MESDDISVNTWGRIALVPLAALASVFCRAAHFEIDVGVFEEIMGVGYLVIGLVTSIAQDQELTQPLMILVRAPFWIILP